MQQPMLRKLHLIIVVASAVGVAALVAVMSRGVEYQGVRVRGKVIEIHGSNYTLARLAREIGDPHILAYDPQKRECVAKASLVIYGSLQVGHPTKPPLGETLFLDTVVCGDLRLEVAPGGTLRVHHATVQTVSQIITAEACSRGYGLLVSGTLEAADSRFLYMSGTQSKTARRGATVKLKRVSFALSDGTSFRCVDADGARLSIEDSKFRCEGQYGFIVEGSGGAPIRLRRCRLFGTSADVQLMGRAAVELIDCQFSRQKVKFYHRGGRVAVRWTVGVRVTETGSRKPLRGVEVAAISTGSGDRETVRATTDADGACRLLLTEYVATPNAPGRQRGVNNVTPHRIVARGPGGRVVAEAARYEARGPRGTVSLRASPATLSSR